MAHGEAAGLRWHHYDSSTPVLGQLVIATSYDKGHTKTKRTRYMLVHPTLAASLAEWKMKGWPEMMGRTPTPEDLVVPMPRPTNRGPRVEHGRMRTDHHSYKRLVKDLEVLGLRHRRGHDLRRTMISLARTDVARKDILELGTHTPRKSGSAIDLYTTFPWEALCAEVAKLKVQRHERGQLARLSLAASAAKENPVAPCWRHGAPCCLLLAVPIVPLRGAVVAFAEPAVRDLVRVRIDAGLIGVVLADDDVFADLVGLVDEAVADLRAGGETGVVVGLEAQALLAKP